MKIFLLASLGRNDNKGLAVEMERRGDSLEAAKRKKSFRSVEMADMLVRNGKKIKEKT